MRKARKKQAEEWSPPPGRWRMVDGEAMAAAYETSGLSMRAFAAQHGLGTHRVSYWLERIGGSKRDGGIPSLGFVPVRVAGAQGEARTTGNRRVDVQLLSGRVLTLRGDWDETAVRIWVSALEATR